MSFERALYESLLSSSLRKMNSSDRLVLDSESSESKFSLAYDSLRECLEAIALKKGYKVSNHECYTHFLKEIMSLERESIIFDKLRKMRNAVSYYGKRLDAGLAKELILFCKELIKILRTVIEDEK